MYDVIISPTVQNHIQAISNNLVPKAHSATGRAWQVNRARDLDMSTKRRVRSDLHQALQALVELKLQ